MLDIFLFSFSNKHYHTSFEHTGAASSRLPQKDFYDWYALMILFGIIIANIHMYSTTVRTADAASLLLALGIFAVAIEQEQADTCRPGAVYWVSVELPTYSFSLLRDIKILQFRLARCE